MKKRKHIDGQKLVNDALENILKWNVDDVRWDEISDGNINYIYRIINKKTRESYVLKVADNATRVKPNGYLSPSRNAHEAGVLKYYSEKDSFILSPKVFAVNKRKNYFLMEDIVPSVSLRHALMEGVMPFNLGIKLSKFIIEKSFPLLEIVNSDREIEKPCYLTYSKDLIKITEDLVFTFPYYDIENRNVYTKENESYFKEMLLDSKLHLISAKLKEKFKTYKQSLIHGDLHTGSILVKFKGERVLNEISDNMELFIVDPEFAFYGPIAYDVGNVLAHFYFVKIYNTFIIKDEVKRNVLLSFYQNEIESFISSFYAEGFGFLKENVIDALYNNEEFINDYMKSIIDDAFRYAGLEIIRRVVGSAKVLEIESVEDANVRIPMERKLMDIGLKYILNGSLGV